MKKKKWMRKRHQVVLFLLRIVFKPLSYIVWGARFKRLPDLKNPHLIFCNHQTVWDQFLLGMMCSNKTYFVMSNSTYNGDATAVATNGHFATVIPSTAFLKETPKERVEPPRVRSPRRRGLRNSLP